MKCVSGSGTVLCTDSGETLTSVTVTKTKKPESMLQHAIRLTMGITMTASPPRDSSTK
jgi:hypothetical protein